MSPERDHDSAHMNIARAAVILDGARFGALHCPVCRQGSLRYSVSRRGLVYARCTNPRCVVVFE